MAKSRKPADITVQTFADHEIITQPNPLRAMVRHAENDEHLDHIARAEEALSNLSSEFDSWMKAECDRLVAAHLAVIKLRFSKDACEDLFRAAHDIKGDAATFGYPAAGMAAESLCRIVEHAPDLSKVPADLLTHHVDAVLAIVREHDRIDAAGVADELCKRLRGLADEYLTAANKDRPDHLAAIHAPPIAPQS